MRRISITLDGCRLDDCLFVWTIVCSFGSRFFNFKTLNCKWSSGGNALFFSILGYIDCFPPFLGWRAIFSKLLEVNRIDFWNPFEKSFLGSLFMRDNKIFRHVSRKLSKENFRGQKCHLKFFKNVIFLKCTIIICTKFQVSPYKLWAVDFIRYRLVKKYWYHFWVLKFGFIFP